MCVIAGWRSDRKTKCGPEHHMSAEEQTVMVVSVSPPCSVKDSNKSKVLHGQTSRQLFSESFTSLRAIQDQVFCWCSILKEKVSFLMHIVPPSVLL